MMNDIIFLDRIRMSVRIGHTEAEQREPQPIVVSLRIEAPTSAAGRSDRLEDSIDYAAVEQQTRALAEARPFNLVEALAEAIAQCVLAFGAVGVWVRVEKKSLKSTDSVGVEIWRARG